MSNQNEIPVSFTSNNRVVLHGRLVLHKRVDSSRIKIASGPKKNALHEWDNTADNFVDEGKKGQKRTLVVMTRADIATFSPALSLLLQYKFPALGIPVPANRITARQDALFFEHGSLAIRVCHPNQLRSRSGYILPSAPGRTDLTVVGHVAKGTVAKGSCYFSATKVLDDSRLPPGSRFTVDAVGEYLRNSECAYPCVVILFDLTDVAGEMTDWMSLGTNGVTANNFASSKFEMIISGGIPINRILSQVTLQQAPGAHTQFMSSFQPAINASIQAARARVAFRQAQMEFLNILL